jgi:hypothetical protein
VKPQVSWYLKWWVPLQWGQRVTRGVLEACPEGVEVAVGCMVELVGVGVNPILAAIEGDNKYYKNHSVSERSEEV